MHIRVRVAIVSDEKPRARGFGRGMVMLLDQVEKTGSIKKAAKAMNMAYSKAWKMLKETESEFGAKLLIRDGHRGSTLSLEAKRLRSAYKDLVQETEKAANSTFRRHYKKLLETKKEKDNSF